MGEGVGFKRGLYTGWPAAKGDIVLLIASMAGMQDEDWPGGSAMRGRLAYLSELY